MGIDRRSFFQLLGISGTTLLLGNKSWAQTENHSNIDFYGMLIDTTRCVGCQTCEVSCSEANGLPEQTDSPEPGKNRLLNETNFTVVNAYNTSKGDVYVKKQCMHCSQAACASACLTKAMHKTIEGPVVWDENKCMGCRYCMVSCPFEIPKFEFHSPNPKIQKCTLCFARLKEGKIPACAENCPAEAILFGTRRELLAEAHKRIAENTDQYVNEIYGEYEAGGTGVLYLSPVPFEELGFNVKIQKSSYPELSKGFLYGVPSVFVLWPAILLGLYESTKNDPSKTIDYE